MKRTPHQQRAIRTAKRPFDDVWAQERDHFVYRLYDSTGHLLYVGCSKRLARRLATHRRLKPWASRIAQCVADGPFRRFTALAVEASAIRRERPEFNRLAGGPRAMERRAYYRARARRRERAA